MKIVLVKCQKIRKENGSIVIVKLNGITKRVRLGNQSNSDKNDEIKQLTDSVKYMSDKFDQFNLTVGKILNEMKELRDQNQIIFEKNEKLSTEVQQLKAKIDELDQKSLEYSVEITGILIM